MKPIKIVTFDDDAVIINGQTYKKVATETEQQAKAVEPQKKKTGWERAQSCDCYYVIRSAYCNGYDDLLEENDGTDRLLYHRGDYYTNEELAKNISRAVHLWLRIQRWQAENDEPITKKEWANNAMEYFLSYDYECNLLYVGSLCQIREPFQIYFSSKEKAEEAMEEFKDNLIWYFTEFKSRMDA